VCRGLLILFIPPTWVKRPACHFRKPETSVHDALRLE